MEQRDKQNKKCHLHLQVFNIPKEYLFIYMATWLGF
jgi:hypothetical protein